MGNPVKAILLIDHGSRLAEANHMLECMANLVQTMVGGAVVVRHAHMELAAPDIEQGVDACVAAGATEVIAFPYMLSPGRHATSDIPRLVEAAAARHPGVLVRTTSSFGVHEKLAEVILLRAGVSPAPAGDTPSFTHCWHPSRSGTACGDACRARAEEGAPALTATG